MESREEKLQMFRNRLGKVFRHIGKQAKKQGIGCYRVYNHDLPEFPFCIELYEHNIYLAEYKRRHGMTEEEHDEWLKICLPVIAEILERPAENIYLRQRRRKEGRDDQYEKVAAESHNFIVEEAGLKFIVNLTEYLDTGLFLDHRITRGMLRSEAANKRVLNLFCYTGSFSVYAAAGGASLVDSVDLSNTYLTWAQKNMRLNGFDDPQKFRFIHADVKQYLDELPPDYYDLVIMDPPTFSNSKRMVGFLDIQRDHADLINGVLRNMRTDARLFFSTNFSRFELDRERINAVQIRDITAATTPFDFQGKLNRFCFRITK